MADFRSMLSRALLRAQEALEPAPTMSADEVKRRISVPVEPSGDRVPVMASRPIRVTPPTNISDEEVAV